MWFQSHFFQDFSLSLVFRRLTMMCLGVNFFGLIMCGVHSLKFLDLWVCVFIEFEMFSVIVHVFFQLHPLSSLLWDCDDMNISFFFVISPQVPGSD